MRYVFTLACLLALPSCNSNDSSSQPAKENQDSISEPRLTPVESGLDSADIVGEWRVAGINGSALSQPYGMPASIKNGQIHITSQCVNFYWDYKLAQGKFAASRTNLDREVCERGRTEDEQALDRTMPMVKKARRLPDGALELTGDDAVITFFTQ